MSENGNAPASPKSLIAVGYVLPAIGVLFLPIVFGPAGAVIGIINIVRGNTGHGIAQLALSGAATLVGMVLGAAVSSM